MKTGKEKQTKQRELKPKLRFPEFRDTPGWKGKKAGVLFDNRTEPGEAGLPIYSVTMNDGMVKRSSLERVVDDIADPEGNKRVYKDDIAYNMMRMWQGAFGVAAEDCVVSPAYVVLSPANDVHSQFFGYLLKRTESLRLLTSHSQSLTKDRLRLYYKDFAHILLRCPSFPEQSKIAACLSSLDELIGAHSRKLDALKAYKKGLMQQLFPREGETLPSLRFPEFQDAGEWKGEELAPKTKKVGSGITPTGGDKNYKLTGRPFVQKDRTTSFHLRPAGSWRRRHALL